MRCGDLIDAAAGGIAVGVTVALACRVVLTPALTYESIISSRISLRVTTPTG